MEVAVVRSYPSPSSLSPTQMELTIEPSFQQSHFVQIERVVHRHLVALDRRLEDPLVHPVLLQYAAQTVHVLAVVQRLHSLGVQKPDRRQERVSQIAQLRLGLTPSLLKTTSLYIVLKLFSTRLIASASAFDFRMSPITSAVNPPTRCVQ